jgi:hypothetical protein
LSRAAIDRFERDAAPTTLGTADAILEALGATVIIEPPQLRARVEQHDAAHALCVDHVRRRLLRLGFLVETELEIGSGSSRGWIDLLALHPARGLLFLDEAKTELRDVGGLQRQIAWYEREAWRAATRLGWRARVLVPAVTVLFTAANDAAIQAHRGSYAAAFPTRAVELQAILEEPESVLRPPPRAIALIDPASRRQAWLRPTMSDGRRSPAPYADYAAFMRSMRERRRAA